MLKALLSAEALEPDSDDVRVQQVVQLGPRSRAVRERRGENWGRHSDEVLAW